MDEGRVAGLGASPASLDIQMRGARAKPTSVSFDFRRKATIFRLPLAAWLASPLGVGDVDVAPGGSDSTTGLVGKLQLLQADAAPPGH